MEGSFLPLTGPELSLDPIILGLRFLHDLDSLSGKSKIEFIFCEKFRLFLQISRHLFNLLDMVSRWRGLLLRFQFFQIDLHVDELIIVVLFLSLRFFELGMN